MICYVIKNSEGKYFKNLIFFGLEDYWGDISEATTWRSDNYPKNICPPSCKVVKVEIREVEDE